MKLIMYTAFALFAFAGNSVLCRLALGEGAIDAGSFTSVRLLSGAITLLLILLISNKNAFVGSDKSVSKGSWLASIYLFVYAVTFSYAYISLDTGVGALVLFGTVQVTMISYSVIRGAKLTGLEYLGALIAFLGLVYLLYPDLTKPTFLGFVLMFVSGIAWGLYTLAGLGSKQPLSDTAYNFLRTLPFVVVLIAFSIAEAELTMKGVYLAVLSGAIASGLGYAVWYAALRNLAAIRVSILQLLVPIIAAAGGVVFASEQISLRLISASLLTLGGILLVLLAKSRGAR